jgi:hypothetical protein
VQKFGWLQMSKETITTTEILAIMKITTGHLSHIRNAHGSAMPRPINDHCKFLVYDRAAILAWIAAREAKKTAPVVPRGLDNKLAVAFLSRGRHG